MVAVGLLKIPKSLGGSALRSGLPVSRIFDPGVFHWFGSLGTDAAGLGDGLCARVVADEPTPVSAGRG
jgi:hypothetical protein